MWSWLNCRPRAVSRRAPDDPPHPRGGWCPRVRGPRRRPQRRPHGGDGAHRRPQAGIGASGETRTPCAVAQRGDCGRQAGRPRAVRLPIQGPDAQAAWRRRRCLAFVVYEPERPIAAELSDRKASGATWLELARWLDARGPNPTGAVVALAREHMTPTDLPGRSPLGRARQCQLPRPDRQPRVVARRAQQKLDAAHLAAPICFRPGAGAGCGRRLRGTTLGRDNGQRAYKCATREW